VPDLSGRDRVGRIERAPVTADSAPDATLSGR